MAVETVPSRPLPSARPLPARAARALPPARSSVPPIADNATVVARVDHGPSIARFTVRSDAEPMPVRPGQYLALGLVVDGRLLQRPYSTASALGSHIDLEFLIRLVPGGTLTPRLWELQAGDRLHLGRPKGLFTLTSGDARAHLFIATGTGLAPFVAMTRTLLEAADAPRIVMVHGVAHAEELAYRDRFERWAADRGVGYIPAISRPDSPANVGWDGATGRVDALLDRVWSANGLTVDDSIAYLCGNPGMIAAATGVLSRLGMPEEAVRSEHYWPA